MTEETTMKELESIVEYIQWVKDNDPFLSKAIGSMTENIPADHPDEAMKAVVAMMTIALCKMSHDNALLREQVQAMITLVGDKI